MKRLMLFLFGLVLVLPVSSHAAAEHLQFTFRYHCEEADTSCDSEISEEEEYFIVPQVTGMPIKIDLVIENPKREMISSVRAKLKYNTEEIEISDLDTQDSDFSLAAPNENDIDEEEGTVIIGRSFTGESRSDEEFLIGTLTIAAKTAESDIDFLNYQDTELGDTGIFFTSGRTTENRLKEEPKGLQFGNSGQANVQVPIDLPVNIGGDNTIEENPYIDIPASLSRPTELRIQTDDKGNIRLIWPIKKDEPIQGYYLYYSQKSGYYLRRRDVGKTNFALFPNLPQGEKYYFAIKAYDANDRESSYSNEVFVTVGLPGSESHGFTGDPIAPKDDENATDIPQDENNAEDIDKTVDSGPEHIFFFLVISLGIAFLTVAFRKLRT